MSKIIALLFLLSFYQLQPVAQVQYVKGKTAYDFCLHLPANDIMKSKPPVLIFLHGRNLCGSNLKYLTEGKPVGGSKKKPAYGVICEIKNRGREVPAIVAAPQFPEGSHWEPDKVLDVLNYIQKSYDTDTSRVYVTGMSSGGFGTLHFAGKYPHRVTAAAALCGGGNTADACNLSRIPLWIMVGTSDSKYFVSASDEIAKAIRKCDGGPLLTYSRLHGKGHGDLEEYYRTTDTLYNWLFSHTKNSNSLAVNTVSASKDNREMKGNSSKAKEKQTEAAIGDKSSYIVSVGAFQKESNAKQLASELKKSGIKSGYLWMPNHPSLGGKKYYCVYIGPFNSQSEADRAKEKYKKKYPDAYSILIS